MKIGIGLPAAVPGVAVTAVGEWAAAGERHGFCSVGAIDRLVYDNIDPLVALAAAAARTERVELLTTVLTVPYRRNAVVLAKQMASIDQLSGSRLTAGLGLGGWPEDYAASDVPRRDMGAAMDAMVETMREVWDGKITGAGGPILSTPAGRPGLLFAGFVPAAYARAAIEGEGWVAPSFGLDPLVAGVTAMRDVWAKAGRSGQPRVVTLRYFQLGDGADDIADRYLHHYYGEGSAAVLADTPRSGAHLDFELNRLAEAGCDDLVLFPCSDDISQLELLAQTLDDIGVAHDPTEGRVLTPVGHHSDSDAPLART